MSKTAYQTGYDDFMNAGYFQRDIKDEDTESYWNGWWKARKEVVKKYASELNGEKIAQPYMTWAVVQLWKKQKGWDYVTKETINEFNWMEGKTWIKFHAMFGIPYEVEKEPPTPMPHQNKLYITNFLKKRLPNPDAEIALEALRRIFKKEKVEKVLGYYASSGTFVETSLRRVCWNLGVRNAPDFPCLVQVSENKIVTVDYHEIEY